MRWRCTIVVLGLVLAIPAHAEVEPRRLDFDEVLARALRGPRAAMARAEARAAEARVDEAVAARIAGVELTGFAAPSPEIECMDPACTRTEPSDASLALAGVFAGVRATAVQPLYTFGKLDSVSRAARAAARATHHLADATAGDIAVDAARAYYGVKLARELRWMLSDGDSEVSKALVRVNEELETGTGEVTLQDRFRLETLQAEVRARLSEARQAEATALAGLRALVGAGGQEEPARPAPPIDVDEAPLDPVSLALEAAPAGYADRARSRRPEVRAARDAAAAADAGASLEAARFWPDLALVGSAEIAAAQGVDDPPSAFADDPFNTSSAALALALRWTIDPFGQRARLARARAQRDRAGALVETAEALAGFDARRAYHAASEARARVDATRAGQKSARGWIASVLQGQAVGTVSAKDLADAYIAYFTLRARFLEATYQWNVAAVELRRATGEFAAPR